MQKLSPRELSPELLNVLCTLQSILENQATIKELYRDARMFYGCAQIRGYARLVGFEPPSYWRLCLRNIKADISHFSKEAAKLLQVEREKKRKAPKEARSLCGAKTRTGRPCQAKAVQRSTTQQTKNHRCRLHGGSSTGPKTQEGKNRVAEVARARMLARWEEKRSQMAINGNVEEARECLQMSTSNSP